jgi:DHA3 family macrolide efflux protein-like MFS transporter
VAYLSVLMQPKLAMLWLSQLLSAIGDHLFIIAITWLAVAEAGSSAAFVSAAGLMAGLVFGLFGGVYADRWNRRRTMITVDLLRALVVCALPVLALTHTLHLWHLIAIAVITEMLGSLFDPALQSELPLVCEDAGSLQAMNALMVSNHRFARIFGPGMTGLLLLVLPLPHFFTVDAISFAISALVLGRIGSRVITGDTRSVSSAQRTHSPLAGVRMAFARLWHHRSLRWAVFSLGLINMAWSAAFMMGLPLLAKESLHGGVTAYGLLSGAYGVGNVLSLLVSGGMAFRRRLKIMFVGQLILGIGFLIVAMSSGMALALVGTMVAAFGSPMGDLIMLTMIQTDFPNDIGKIYSVRSFVGSMGLAVGLLAAVPLFRFFSPSFGIGLCALAIVATGTIGMFRLDGIQPTYTVGGGKLTDG